MIVETEVASFKTGNQEEVQETGDYL